MLYTAAVTDIFDKAGVLYYWLGDIYIHCVLQLES